MTFDALTLSAVRDELERELLGGQIQRVVLTGPLTLVLEVYARGRRQGLICCADAQAARVCLVEERPVRDSDRPTPFLLLLRKYVRDGRIAAIEQPPYERLLRLRITKRDEQGTPAEVWLIIEVMGRRSNAVLTDADGAILDALRRASANRNPRRPIWPRHRYQEPPPQRRLDPLDEATYDTLREVAAGQPERLVEDLLAANLAGFSPLASREAAFRARCLGLAGSRAGWESVYAAVRNLLEPLRTHVWSPSVCLREERPIAFAAYRLTHLSEVGELREIQSISQAVDLGLAAPAGASALPPDRRSLVGSIDELRRQSQRKVAALERSLAAADAATELQHAGEAVLANLATITAGQSEFEFAGKRFRLDPALTPLENAQRLFEEHRKARDAARQVPLLLETTRLRMRELDELRVLAELADTPAKVRALREEISRLQPPNRSTKRTEAQDKRQRHPAADVGRVARHRTPQGLDVLVGTSARGNESVTFKLASAEDLWLHARGVPGAHVILRTGGRDAPTDSLTFAARLAARHSQSRESSRVEVDYTPRKRVRKVPGGAVGLVTYSGERTIAVDPRR